MATEEELRATRLAKAQALRELGRPPYPNDLRVTAAMEEARRDLLALSQDETRVASLPMESDLDESADPVDLYGRVIAKRGPFLVVRTPYGDAQALVRKELLCEEEAAQLAKVDLADHIWVAGTPMRTKAGQMALRATRYKHMSKALLPPPAKWHGLKDVEKRYRERYVDLFANPAVADVFRARAAIVSGLRNFLNERRFLEVETPMLQFVRGGATAHPFETHHNALDLDLFMRIAPELFLKRLLVGGFDRVYEIGRCFRNEGISTRHNPEFTMLELYQAYATYEDVMSLGEEMLRTIDQSLASDPHLGQAFGDRSERSFDLEETFARIPMRQAIRDRLERSGKDGIEQTLWQPLADIDLDDPEALAAFFQKLQGRVDPVTRKQLAECDSHGERIFITYELLVEGDLVRLYRTADGKRSKPVFITEYPFEVSPLARRNDDDPRFVDRFELFIDGREIANAFSELNDPEDQAERFRAQLAAKERGKEETMDFDADYIRALDHGMPPAAGFGLGVDRLAMLLCGQSSIRDVLLFPLLRPEA